MRTFCKLNTSFWTDETGRKLRAGGPQLQVLAIYLFSNRHSTYTGIYVLPKMYIAADLCLDLSGIDAMLCKLDEMNYAKYDESTETVWVIDAAREQLGECLKAGDKMVKAVQRELSELPKKCILTAQFIERYADAYHLNAEAAAPAKRQVIAEVERPAAQGEPTEQPGKVEKHEREGQPNFRFGLLGALDWFIERRNKAQLDHWLSDEKITSMIAEMALIAEPQEIANLLRDAHTKKDYDLRKLPAKFHELFGGI